MKIAIRADGNANIGLGHIQRCLTLSSQLKKKGAKVIFVVKEDKIVKEKVKQEGFEVIELEHNLNLDKDLRYIVKTIKENKIDILITDSYEFDEKYLIEVKKNVALLVSIDDLAEIAFPSDILINQNIYAKELSYRSLTAKTEFLSDGAVAAIKRKILMDTEGKVGVHEYLGRDIRAVIQEPLSSLEVDRLSDFELAEWILTRK